MVCLNIEKTHKMFLTVTVNGGLPIDLKRPFFYPIMDDETGFFY
jgi:hypothetical protein